MERIRQSLAALRNNRRGGAALLIALCAGALLLSLTLSLIYAASVPLARAVRKLEQERCRMLAVSFAKALDVELQKYTAGTVLPNWEERVWDNAVNQAAETGAFYNQVNAVLEDSTYADYDETDPSTIISFKQDDGNRDKPYGDLEIRLRKTDLTDNVSNQQKTFRESITEAHDTTFNSYGSFPYENAAEGTKTAELDNKFIRYQVQVDVAAELGREKVLYSSYYNREDCYQPRYTWHVVNLDSLPANFSLYQPEEGRQTAPVDEVPVFWEPSDRKFYLDEEKTTSIEPVVWYWDEPDYDAEGEISSYSRHTWVEKVVISYVYYDESGDFHPTYKHYVQR